MDDPEHVDRSGTGSKSVQTVPYTGGCDLLGDTRSGFDVVTERQARSERGRVRAA
jgi:hypothetical protein